MENSSSNNFCPVCGSDRINKVKASKNVAAPFGPSVSYSDEITICLSCGSEVDSSDPDAFPKAIKDSETKSIELILNYLGEKGYSMSSIERALDLPTRTLSNWKSKEKPAASGLALLRILRALPWTIDIADHHFESTAIKENLVSAAAEAIDQERREIEAMRNWFLHQGVSTPVSSGAKSQFSRLYSSGSTAYSTIITATSSLAGVAYRKEVDSEAQAVYGPKPVSPMFHIAGCV